MVHPDQPVLSREERRARREERRQKQRTANVGRATKMHQARLGWEKEHSAPVTRVVSSSSRPELHIGCSGWFYWHWKGAFYPVSLPTGAWFGHYARRFQTVELNAPFYSWPTVEAVKRWMQQIGQRKFVYTVKACELITHVKRFQGTKTLIRDFGYIADLLGPRMGCFLFQLPPSFRFTMARLTKILSQLDPARRNVVEFRHPSWWNEDVFAAFREVRAIFCSCSGPRLPDTLIKTADDIYVRFHGVKRWYRHDYSRAELEAWVQRIQASGAKRVWVYFNNDRDGYAIKNARELGRMLRTAG